MRQLSVDGQSCCGRSFTCVLQVRTLTRAQKRSSMRCQAIAEPQTKPVSEDQMRIANDVSELIGVYTLWLVDSLAVLYGAFCILHCHSHAL